MCDEIAPRMTLQLNKSNLTNVLINRVKTILIFKMKLTADGLAVEMSLKKAKLSAECNPDGWILLIMTDSSSFLEGGGGMKLGPRPCQGRSLREAIQCKMR